MGFMGKVKSALNWRIEDEYDDLEEVQEKSEKLDRADQYDRLHASDKVERVDRFNRFDKPAKKEKRRGFGDSENKVVSIHLDENVRVANLRLQSFEDARKVDMHLKLSRTVLVDVSGLDKVEGQRSIDFICGIIEALEASIQKMPNTPIFVITPKGTSIVGDVNDEFKYKGVFPWIK